MADKDEQKKNDKKADPNVITAPIHINTGEFAKHSPISLGIDYKSTLDFGRETYSGIGGIDLTKNDRLDIGAFGNSVSMDAEKYKLAIGVTPQSGAFTTQSSILGISSTLGDSLMGMDINSIGDRQNFLIGVNNIASQFASNSALINTIESISSTALKSSKLIVDAMQGIDTSAINTGFRLASEGLKRDQVIKLSESMTTVLAYGKAVQHQFSSGISTNETLKNGVAVFGGTPIAWDKISDYSSLSVGPNTITSPFVYAPQRIKTEEVEEVLPEVKKDLPVKITEAIEIIEYIQDPETKDDDKVISNTIGDLKRAVKTILNFSVMFTQQTTQKVEIIAMPTVQTSLEKSTLHTNKFPFKIPAGTTWQSIIIQFTDSNYVNIQVAGHSHPTGYADMGFVDKRTSKPTIQWALLSLLAKGGGFLPASSSDANDKYKKHKQLLADKLKEYFSIEPDPFEPYKGGYKTKITLVPPPAKKTPMKGPIPIADEIEDMFRELDE